MIQGKNLLVISSKITSLRRNMVLKPSQAHQVNQLPMLCWKDPPGIRIPGVNV